MSQCSQPVLGLRPVLVNEHGLKVEDRPRVPGLVPRAVVLGGGRVVGADLVDVAVVDALEALLPVAEAVVAPMCKKSSERVQRTAKKMQEYTWPEAASIR